MMATSWEIPHPLITKCSLKITCLKSKSNLPGVNELIWFDHCDASAYELQPLRHTEPWGIIPCMHPPNERWLYNLMLSLTGWVHAQKDPWTMHDLRLRWFPMRFFINDFDDGHGHQWKSLANCFMDDKKIIFPDLPYIIGYKFFRALKHTSNDEDTSLLLMLTQVNKMVAIFQMTFSKAVSNTESVSIWWRHHDMITIGAWTEWLTFCKYHFQMHFVKWLKFHWNMFQRNQFTMSQH